MTQKEAIIKALEKLGGKAKMVEICKLAQHFGDFGGSQAPSNTIRNCIYKNPCEFRSSGGGYWELVSYQEDIAVRDREIAELRAEVERLKSIPTEDAFVKRLVKETKNLYKHEKGKTEVIRQILYKVGRTDAEEELDAWIEGKEQKPSVSFNGDIVLKSETNIGTNYGPNIEHNGGTMSLPEGIVATPLPESEDDKQ